MTESLIAFGVVLILAFLGIPLAFATLLVGFGGFWLLRGADAGLSVSSQWIIDTATNYNLSVIPLFVLMGAFIHRSGIAQELFDASYAWMGRFKGGLAMSTIFSCAGFAAVCGSSLATAATMSRVSIPSMRKYAYHDGFSAGTVAAGGTLGIMIPPSVPLVIYGIVANEDIGKLFIAGILPGILLVLSFIAAVFILTSIKPHVGPKGDKLDWSAIIKASLPVWPVMLLFGLVLGGIYGGLFTPTEAAGVGAFGSWLFGFIRGHFRSINSLISIGKEVLTTSSMIFAILFGALVLTQFVNVTGMPYELLDWVSEQQLSPTQLVLMICLICGLLGMVFESIGILLLVVPVFMPSLSALGIDLIWFGIVMIIVIELGLITPPIGLNVFTVKAVAPEIPLSKIFIGVSPFIVAMVASLLLIAWVPAIATWLPSAMSSGF
jgi:tripartite ATP-independent transporter DctM subunit